MNFSLGKAIALLVVAVFAAVIIWNFAGIRPASAAPPAVGTEHVFIDPNFGSTIFCDDIEHLKTIVEAEDPYTAFGALYEAPNAVGQPTCDALSLAVGAVDRVEVLPDMVASGVTFIAWAVRITLPSGTIGWGLYLEPSPPAAKSTDTDRMRRDYRAFRHLNERPPPAPA